jgi:DNA-binding response OmpR family regulator
MAEHRKRILLVEDDEGVRRPLSTWLTRAGYEVVVAADGAEAVRLWREMNGGDLAVIDMFLPEKDGLECIIELRTHSPGVPIIAISGGGGTGRVDILDDAKLLGAVATLQKPFDPRALLAMVILELTRRP